MYKKSRSQGFGPEVKRRIMLGSFVLSSGYYDAYYLKALRTKALIKQAFDRAFARFDVILGPAAPTTAPRLGESLSDPLKMYLGDLYTVSVNLAGLPAMTLPCGIGSKGLPIGLQLIGDCFQEKKIIRAAYTYERTRSYQAPALDGYLAAGQPGAAGGSEPGAAGGGCPGAAGGSEPGAAGGGCPGTAGGSEPEAAETSRQTAATEQEVQ
jgi:hypothetical protein